MAPEPESTPDSIYRSSDMSSGYKWHQRDSRGPELLPEQVSILQNEATHPSTLLPQWGVQLVRSSWFLHQSSRRQNLVPGTISVLIRSLFQVSEVDSAGVDRIQVLIGHGATTQNVNQLHFKPWNKLKNLKFKKGTKWQQQILIYSLDEVDGLNCSYLEWYFCAIHYCVENCRNYSL